MKLNLQKRLAAKLAKVGKQRIVIHPDAAEDVKAAITTADVGGLISEGKIEVINKRGVSRHRARKLNIQRQKGRRKGQGTRKGKKYARLPRKTVWMHKIRLQRATIKKLKADGKIEDTKIYRRLYLLAKGGFFRSKKHLLLYATQNKMIKGDK
jgi:large subunit ribosomal protein L19e